ncbi:MAG: glycosyltransferase, partial [Hyphomicrobium sp.]|nr:glycosyltransferase [Hyphomicrobium sp.]
MADFVTAAALIFCLVATATHLVTIALALFRVMSSPARPRGLNVEPVSIIRPVCGRDHFDEMTLHSTFELRGTGYEIIFCAAREDDPAVPFVRKLIASYPHVEAKLLIGDDRPTSNPKLNNIVKGWAAARFPWIVLADNNVLMPKTYLDDLFRSFEPNVGLVCSPPVGSHPIGFWAELECAFLNTYQARWQSAADTGWRPLGQGPPFRADPTHSAVRSDERLVPRLCAESQIGVTRGCRSGAPCQDPKSVVILAPTPAGGACRHGKALAPTGGAIRAMARSMGNRMRRHAGSAGR